MNVPTNKDYSGYHSSVQMVQMVSVTCANTLDIYGGQGKTGGYIVRRMLLGCW